MKANGSRSAVPQGWGALVLLWLVGLYLRLPVLVAPPLAPPIGEELGLNQSQLGALTTIPVLMLALGALPGSFAIARLGARVTVVAALVVLALASSARGLAPPTLLLFCFTGLMGLAIAVMQPAMPVLVRSLCERQAERGSAVQRSSARRLALGSAVYMNGLLMGEFIGGGLTLPWVMPWLDGDWRATLVFWSMPALAVAGALHVYGRRHPGGSPAGPPGGVPAWNPRWTEGRVWKYGLLLGAASAGFFGTNAYLGSLLESRGQGDQLGTVLLYFNATQVAGSLLMLVLAPLTAGRHWPVTLVACLLPVSLLGTGMASGVLFHSAVVVLGLCTCLQLILMVSLVPLVADEREAGPLAAGMFAVGYLLGFVVPLAGGVLADVTGIARLALLPMGVLAALGAAVALTPGFGHGLPPRSNP